VWQAGAVGNTCMQRALTSNVCPHRLLDSALWCQLLLIWEDEPANHQQDVAASMPSRERAGTEGPQTGERASERVT